MTVEVRKERAGAVRGAARPEDLARINTLAKAQLTAEEVYVFSVRLCDNEVDRDFERFDPAALERLGELFLGKSGLFDHNWSAEGQTARIYHTEVCREAAVKTGAGDALCYLKGWAYMLRSEKNADLIAEIEAGIKKEVSVGCAMGRSVCAVCGAQAGECQHVKGQTYGGQLCFFELKDPTDAYEWSFVAVPAQRQAGVLKRYGGEKRLSAGEWAALEKEAALGRSYLAGLRKEVCRLALLADETLDGAVFQKIAGKLEEGELQELKRVYGRRAEEKYRPAVQLGAWTKKAGDENTDVFLV